MKQKTASKNFWTNKRILLTGFNGFKGAWMTLMLSQLGAKVYGYSLNGKKEKKNNKYLKLEKNCKNFFYGDILDKKKLRKFYNKANPNLIIHMASKAVVLESFDMPIDYFKTNILGLINVILLTKNKKIPILVLTSDKCYQNKENKKSFIETDSLSGDDPYSASKACQEIVCNSLRKSYKLKIATARAGNVIGGCDFTKHRIIADIMSSIFLKRKINIRNPNATRPWQHVLEINANYLKFLKNFYSKPLLASAWNFGPKRSYKVKDIINFYLKKKQFKYSIKKYKINEKINLGLSSLKLERKLKIKNNMTLKNILENTYRWYEKLFNDPKNIYKFSIQQVNNAIHEFRLHK